MKGLFSNESRFFNIGKKILSGALIFATVFTFTFSIRPEKARALPTVDTASLMLVVKEYALDMIGWMVGDVLLTIMSAEITQWANEGFGSLIRGVDPVTEEDFIAWATGDTYFLTHPEQFFSDMARAVSLSAQDGIEETLRRLVGTDKSPLQLDPQITAKLERLINERHFKSFEDSMRMTKSPEEIANFLDDFMEGGWSMWTEIAINPQNTPRGALLLAEQEVERRLRESRENIERELMEGSGFMPSRTCVEGGYDPSHPEADAFGCIEYEEVTPGTTTENQIARALGMELDRAMQADEITEIIANMLVREFINLIEDGLTGVRGDLENFLTERRDALRGHKSDGEEALTGAKEQWGELMGAQEEFTESAVSRAEETRDPNDIATAQQTINMMPEGEERDKLQKRLDNIETEDNDNGNNE